MLTKTKTTPENCNCRTFFRQNVATKYLKNKANPHHIVVLIQR